MLFWSKEEENALEKAASAACDAAGVKPPSGPLYSILTRLEKAVEAARKEVV